MHKLAHVTRPLSSIVTEPDDGKVPDKSNFSNHSLSVTSSIFPYTNSSEYSTPNWFISLIYLSALALAAPILDFSIILKIPGIAINEISANTTITANNSSKVNPLFLFTLSLLSIL